MEITRIGSQPSCKGPEDWFTGSVRIDPLFQPNEHRMTLYRKIYRLIHVWVFSLSILTVAKAQNPKQMVRLAIIEVDTTQINNYNEFLKEEIEASIKKEPGVITLYAVSEKENPERITLFETYADSAQYKSHLSTPHFQKYKQGTLQMVTHLDLIETKSLLYHRKSELSKLNPKNFYIRLIKIELDPNSISDFNSLANYVMMPGLKTESGVLVMYAVAEKNNPAHISILEVYEDSDSYSKHIKTPHFLKYKDQSAKMVKSLKLIDVNPILLGSKPQ
ncbi:antibiotic biosynthesis monooxygenase [Chryseolinea sp. T2]|uniref:putative quinol monooxygenase n=1 Tax=Chryseolinea sp. T2 TaxID=3129255 RepID=UPI003078061C